MNTDSILQQMFECAYHILLYRQRELCMAGYGSGYNPMDATVGEMDWIWELNIIMERTGLKTMNEDPNARQIGGEHYRKANPSYQHWDLVAEFGMNYFTGQITRYVSRWRNKDGTRDLEKAIHFTDKLISLYRENVVDYSFDMHIASEPSDRLYRWCDEQKLTWDERQIIELAIVYSDMDDLLRLRGYIVALYELAKHASSQGLAAPEASA